jgi:hypothetical protein
MSLADWLKKGAGIRILKGGPPKALRKADSRWDRCNESEDCARYQLRVDRPVGSSERQVVRLDITPPSSSKKVRASRIKQPLYDALVPPINA